MTPCTSVDTKSTTHGMMGFFPLSTSFQNITVKYDTLPDVATFDKMDVFSVEGQVHVVMTAKQAYDGGQGVTIYTIVDAIELSNGTWLYYILDNTEKSLFFDDVAVTDKYVVYTARSLRDDNYRPFNTTELWYFNKPTSFGVPVLISSLNIGCLYNWPEGQVLIEHTQADKFIIASKKDMDDLVSSLFDGTNYNSTCRLILDESIDTRDVLDIKYNKYNNKYDILVWNPKNETWYSWTFTIPIPTAWSVGMRLFKDQEIQSIDFLTSSPNYFVASGYNLSGSKLNVCRYNQLIEGDCFYLSTIPSKSITFNYRLVPEIISVKIYDRSMHNLPSEEHNPTNITICN